MDHSARTLATLGLFLVLAVSAGCGGGGGGAEGPLPVDLVSPPFEGTYHYLALGGRTPPVGPEEVLSEFGVAYPDASGSVAIHWRANVSGGVEPPAVSGSTRYRVAPDGTFGWSVPLSEPNPFIRGGLRRDGVVGILASVHDDAMPEFRAVLRRGGALTESSLVGEYHLALWRYSPGSGEHESREGTYWFDGAGAWRGGGSWRGDSGHGWFVPNGSYALGESGGLVITDGTDSIVGGVLDDGSIAFLGGTPVLGRPYFAALVRRHALGGLSEATLSGSYYVVSFAHTAAGYASTIGMLVADGAGHWTLTSRANIEGEFLPSQTTSGGYEIDEFGEFHLSFASGDELVGGVTANGGFACLAAGMTAVMTGPPQIWLLLRR